MLSEEDKAVMFNWFISKDGKEWRFMGTTHPTIKSLLLEAVIVRMYPYTKVEEVMLHNNTFKVIKVICNTFEEAQVRQQQDTSKEEKEEIDTLNKMYYRGNDQTH